jgi:hypothetical protein
MVFDELQVVGNVGGPFLQDFKVLALINPMLF